MVVITQTINYIQTAEQLEKIVSALESLDLYTIRINLSKHSISELEKTIDVIDSVFSLKANFTLYLDFPFPKNKSRIENLNLESNDNIIREGTEYIVTNNRLVFDKIKKNTILLNADSINSDIGETIFYADGEVMFETVSVSPHQIKMKALNTFLVREGKSIMCGYKIEKDEVFVNILYRLERLKCQKKYLLSFVNNSYEILKFSKLLSLQSDSNIIPKIETTEAIRNISQIIQVSDGIIVARGDLALNLPLENLAKAMDSLIETARKFEKRIIFCTDILRNMNDRIIPERSELFDLIYISKCNCRDIILPASINFRNNI